MSDELLENEEYDENINNDEEINDDDVREPVLSKRVTRTAEVITSFLLVFNRMPFFKMVFLVLCILVCLGVYLYQDELKTFITEKKKYVKVENIDCVSDLLYGVTNRHEIMGVELYIFQPLGHDKEYAERIFSKTKHLIMTPKKMKILNMYSTYNKLLSNNMCIKDGKGDDIIDFAINGSLEAEKAYIFRVSASDGGLYGMMVVYTQLDLKDEVVKQLINTSKYSIKFCE